VLQEAGERFLTCPDNAYFGLASSSAAQYLSVMVPLDGLEIEALFMALGLVLLSARLFGQLAVRLRQPAVLGELVAGILLGPTVLGALAPELQQHLFPGSGPPAKVFDGISRIAICLFLLAAGMEIDLFRIWHQKRVGILVSTAGFVVPFAAGFGVSLLAPGFFSAADSVPPLVSAAFVATALSISALPVIAKILLDLNLYKTDLGAVIIAGALCDDLAGWIMFGCIMGWVSGSGLSAASAGASVLATVCFVLITLTLIRWLVDRLIGALAGYSHSSFTLLGLIPVLTLTFAWLAEVLGIHPNFAAFIFGAALGDCPDVPEGVRRAIDRVATRLLAPFFFAMVGLYINFLVNFDWQLVAAVLAIAILSKVAGCAVGARLGGVSWNGALAIGVGMNARGAVEIVLALLALKAGVITERLFVALVVMAMVTSVLSGALLRRMYAARGAPH
jgi:Kef-type K+ transport system membrane component KefB